MYIYGQNISCWPSKEELLNWQKRCSYFVSFYKEDGLVIKDMLLRNYDTFYCRIQKADMLTYQLHKLEQEVSRLLWDHISWKRKVLVVICKMSVAIKMNFFILFCFVFWPRYMVTHQINYSNANQYMYMKNPVWF